MRVTRTAAAALALLALAAAPGCKRDLPPAVAVFARGADAESLDPQGIDDGESSKAVDNLFEGLVGFAPGTTRPVPLLADRWTASADGLDWEFHLRPGVKFHDGTPLDAAAVEFTFRRLLDRKDPNRPVKKCPYEEFYSGRIERVSAAGPGTVKFRLARPYAPFLANLAMFSAGIVSPKAVQAAGPSAFAKNPVGTGPFRFVSWSQGEKKIVLERNPAYWGEKAKLDRVIFIEIRDNNARLSALRSGSCNWMDGLNPEDLAACRADPKLKVWSATGMNVGYLALNVERKPFDDVRVRRAVALAIDRKKLVDALWHGMGVPAVHPMPPGTLGYDDSVKVPAPDPARAKALLAEAGYPAGVDTELYAMSNPRPYFANPMKIAQVLQGDLEAVGIRTKIQSQGDWALYRDAVSNAKHPMAMLGWTTDNGDPDNFLFTFFSKETATRGSGAQNIAFWVDPKMQNLLRRGQEELDEAKRTAIYREALALVLDQVPMVPIAHTEQVSVSAAGFEGFVVQPTGNVFMAGVRAPGAP